MHFYNILTVGQFSRKLSHICICSYRCIQRSTVRWTLHSCPIVLQGVLFPYNTTLSNQIIQNCGQYGCRFLYLSEGSMDAALQSWPVAHPPSTSPLTMIYFNVYMYMLFSSVVGDTLRASTLGQPPNHDHGVSWFGIQADPMVTIVIHWSLRSSGMKHSCYMPGCGCRLPPSWVKHN